MWCKLCVIVCCSGWGRITEREGGDDDVDVHPKRAAEVGHIYFGRRALRILTWAEGLCLACPAARCEWKMVAAQRRACDRCLPSRFRMRGGQRHHLKSALHFREPFHSSFGTGAIALYVASNPRSVCNAVGCSRMVAESDGSCDGAMTTIQLLELWKLRCSTTGPGPPAGH